jgi:CBS domain-containing protein
MNPAKLPTAEPLLGTQTVADAMHHGIVTCPPSATLREVAHLLAEHEVHCAVVAESSGDDAGALWGIVSDVELMRGLGSPVALTAGNLAALDVITVGPDEDLARAAQLMGEHDVAHLIVVKGAPIGILSTLDVAKAVAAPVSGSTS